MYTDGMTYKIFQTTSRAGSNDNLDSSQGYGLLVLNLFTWKFSDPSTENHLRDSCVSFAKIINVLIPPYESTTVSPVIRSNFVWTDFALR
jgi:hypothetical protein